MIMYKLVEHACVARRLWHRHEDGEVFCFWNDIAEGEHTIGYYSTVELAMKKGESLGYEFRDDKRYTKLKTTNIDDSPDLQITRHLYIKEIEAEE